MKNTTYKTRSEKEIQYLLAIPGIKEKLIEGSKTPIEECENVDDISWVDVVMEATKQDNSI